MGDYVGDAPQYPKWHVSWFRGVTPQRGEMLMVCAFFICSSAWLGTKPLYQTTNFGELYLKMRVSVTVAFPLRLEQQYTIIDGQNPK